MPLCMRVYQARTFLRFSSNPSRRAAPALHKRAADSTLTALFQHPLLPRTVQDSRPAKARPASLVCVLSPPALSVLW